MKVPHVEFVKEKLGSEAIRALGELYKQAKGHPPSVPAERFRADNHEWLDLLDSLEQRYSLIKRGDKGKDYLLNSYALPVIDAANPILTKMQHLYERMTELYPIHLSKPVDIDTLLTGFEGDRNEWIDALYYLTDISGVWTGKSLGFPYADASSMSVSENVLRKKSVAELLSQFYEWHYVNPVVTTTDWHLEDSEGRPNSIFFEQEAKGGFPTWYDELEPIMKSLIREIDGALLNEMSILATIGLRTLIDMVMVGKVGDQKSFAKTLKKFVNEGYTTQKDAELLRGVLDAGSAAAHRAYSPNEEDLKVCTDVVKHMMEGIYILQPKIEKVRENTPPREERKKDE